MMAGESHSALTPLEAVQNARKLRTHLLEGHPPNGVQPSDCGGYEEWMLMLEDTRQKGDMDAVHRLDGILQQGHPAYHELCNPPPPRYTLRWLRDAMQPQPPVAWLIEGLIAMASLTIIFGKPGCKKTWIALKMALCIATGKAFLGKRAEKATALVIDEESGSRRLARRLRALARAQNAQDDAPLAYISLARFNLTREEDVAEVRRLIEELGARLVIIDTMAAATAGVDENAVKEMQPVLASLRKVAEETGAAIVVIHHAGRSGEYRGSSAIAGAVDLLLEVKADAENGNVTIQSEKTRDTEPVHIHAHLAFHEDEDGQVEKVFVTPAIITPPSPSFNAGEEYVLRYLGATTGAMKADIMDNADSCSPETARKGIYSLVRRGFVERIDEGGSGIEAEYALAKSTPYYVSR